MRRTSTIRPVVLIALLVSAPVCAAPPDALPPGAVRRFGLVRQFASSRTGLVAFSADGKRLVAGAGEYTVHVWDWPVSKPPRTFLRSEGQVATCSVLLPHGKRLAVGTINGAVMQRDLDTGAVLGPLHETGESLQEIACSRDSQLCATIGSHAVLRLWNGGKVPAWTRTLGEERVLCLAFAGDRLLAGCADGNIRIWEIEKGKALPALTTGRAIRALAVSADGRTVFAEGADHVLLAWNLATGRVVCRLEGHTDAVVALAFTPDGKRLASTGIDGGVRVWDVDSGEEVCRFYNEDQTALALAFAPDGRALVVATTDSFIDQWDLESLTKIPLIPGHREEVEALAFSDDGKEIQTWSASQAFHWQTATAKLLGPVRSDRPARDKVVNSPGGKYRVTVDPDVSIFPMLVSVETGKEVELSGSLRSVRSAAFSRDDKILAVAGSDGQVTLWETFSGEILAEFRAHEGRANCIAFAPDGRTFATGGGDASVLIWSLTACASEPSERWRDPAAEDLESMWKALLHDGGGEAFTAMRALAAMPKKTVPFLRAKLPPALDLRRMKQFIVQLDSDDFETREKASQELERLGRDAEQALFDALAGKPSAEVRRRIDELLNNLKGDDRPRVRCWSRAVFVLEHIGTPEAREILKLLAEGDRVAKAADDARAALKRK